MLIGEVRTKPQYPEVERAFQSRTGADLGKATWSEWWHGRRVPNATYRTLIDNAFDGLATKWLYRSIDRGRLQRHLAVFDLLWLNTNSPQDAENEAVEFLLTIVKDWVPQRTSYGLLPAVVARGGLVDESPRGQPNRLARLLEFRKPEGPLLRQDLTVRRDTARLLEPLSPASILPYMLRYAAESKLFDKPLKDAFVLDFLTAVNASICLLQMVAPIDVVNWGRPGMIALACNDFFWMPTIGKNEPLWELNDEFGQHVWPLLEELDANVDFDEARDLFYQLREAYYQSLAIVGIDDVDFVEFAEGNVGIDFSAPIQLPRGDPPERLSPEEWLDNITR